MPADCGKESVDFLSGFVFGACWAQGSFDASPARADYWLYSLFLITLFDKADSIRISSGCLAPRRIHLCTQTFRKPGSTETLVYFAHADE